MKVDISEIVAAQGASKDICAALGGPFEGITLNGPAEVSLKLTGFGRGVVTVSGLIKAEAEVVCSRCAGTYSEPLELSVEERFVPAGSVKPEQEEEVELDDLCVFEYEDAEIDIDELVRENLIAGLPYRPLCSPDCKGLCPVCGQNLNEKSCTCGEAEPEIDPRWGALKKFTSGSDKQKGS